MTKERRVYTEEFMKSSAEFAVTCPSIADAARSLGVPATTLHKWVGKYSIKPSKPKALDLEALLAENRRLTKALARAEQEREILKKATAYFAKDQV